MADFSTSKLTGRTLPWEGNPTKDRGGGEPPDDMNARLDALEAGHRSITAQLSEISQSLKVIDTKLDAKAASDAMERIGGDLRVNLADMRGELAQKASATELGTLKGAVDKLPTTLALILSLGGFVVTVFVAAGIAKHFGW